MPKIVWTEKFSVGVAKLDDQHKKWIAMINELHDTLMVGDTAGPNDVGTKTLRSIIEYGEKHFADEEQYLAEIDYPLLEEHKTLHRVFRLQVDGNLRRIEKGELILHSEIMKDMLDWLEKHILIEDKKYGSKST